MNWTWSKKSYIKLGDNTKDRCISFQRPSRTLSNRPTALLFVYVLLFTALILQW